MPLLSGIRSWSSRALIFPVSGFRLVMSPSANGGRHLIFDWDPVTSMIVSARERMLYSISLPMLIVSFSMGVVLTLIVDDVCSQA